MARPDKLNTERHTNIVNALRAGNTRSASASYGGISYQSFLTWLERGEHQKSGKFLEFFDAVKRAESLAEVEHVANIRKAAIDGSWQASAWWLERRRHGDYRKIEQVENTGIDGTPVETVVRIIYEDEECQKMNFGSNDHIQNNDEFSPVEQNGR